MKRAPFFGLGIGVQRNHWLRFDVTGEYRGKCLFVAQDDYAGSARLSRPAPTNIRPTSRAGSALPTPMSISALVRGHAIRRRRRRHCVAVGLGLKDINVQNTVYYGADNTEVNFAWALYAGMSYDVTDRFTLDFGYRYLDLGDAKSGRATAYHGHRPTVVLEIRDMTSHDLMFSARFALDRRGALRRGRSSKSDRAHRFAGVAGPVKRSATLVISGNARRSASTVGRG